MRNQEQRALHESILAVGGQRKEPLKAWRPLGIPSRERGSQELTELRRGLDLAFPSGTIIRDERNPIGIAPVLYAASVYQAIRKICLEVGKEPPPLVIANTSPAVGRILRDEFRDPDIQANIFLSNAHGALYSLLPVTEEGYPGHLREIVRHVNEIEEKMLALDAEPFMATSLTGEIRHFEPPVKVHAINTGAPFSTAAPGEGIDVFPVADRHLYELMIGRMSDIYGAHIALAEQAIPLADRKTARIGLISRTNPHTVQSFPEMWGIPPLTQDIAHPLTPPVQEAMQPPVDTRVDKANGIVFYKDKGETIIASIKGKSHVAYLNISFSSAFGLEQATTLVRQLNEKNIAVLCPPWLRIPGTIPTGPEVMYQVDESAGEAKSVIDFQIARAGQGSTGRSLDMNIPLLTFPGHQELWKESPEIFANEQIINKLGIGTPLVFNERGNIDEYIFHQNLERLPEMSENIKTISEMTRLFGGIPDDMSGADVIAQQIVIKAIERAKVKVQPDVAEQITVSAGKSVISDREHLKRSEWEIGLDPDFDERTMTFRGRYTHLDAAILEHLHLEGKINMLDFGAGVLDFGSPTAHDFIDAVQSSGNTTQVDVVDLNRPERPSYPEVSYSTILDDTTEKYDVVRMLHVGEYMIDEEYELTKRKLITKLKEGGLFIETERIGIKKYYDDTDPSMCPSFTIRMARKDTTMRAEHPDLVREDDLIDVRSYPDGKYPRTSDELLMFERGEDLDGYAQFKTFLDRNIRYNDLFKPFAFSRS